MRSVPSADPCYQIVYWLIVVGFECQISLVVGTKESQNLIPPLKLKYLQDHRLDYKLLLDDQVGLFCQKIKTIKLIRDCGRYWVLKWLKMRISIWRLNDMQQHIFSYVSIPMYLWLRNCIMPRNRLPQQSILLLLLHHPQAFWAYCWMPLSLRSFFLSSYAANGSTADKQPWKREEEYDIPHSFLCMRTTKAKRRAGRWTHSKHHHPPLARIISRRGGF